MSEPPACSVIRTISSSSYSTSEEESRTSVSSSTPQFDVPLKAIQSNIIVGEISVVLPNSSNEWDLDLSEGEWLQGLS